MTILLLHVPPPTTTILLSYSSSPRSTTRTLNLTRRVRCRVSNSSEVVPIPNISLSVYKCLFRILVLYDSQVKSEYKPGVLDDFFMQSFRNKLVEVSLLQIGWLFMTFD